MAKAKKHSESSDLVLLHSLTEDGKGYNVLRRRKGQLEAGAMRPMEQGRPLEGEVVQLRPRKESPLLFDAEVLFESPQKAPPSDTEKSVGAGPSQIASTQYRRNWSRIWGRATRDTQLN